jgi:hypothetical protein
MADPSDDELLKLIIEADDLLLREGEDPRGRSIAVIQRVMAKLGHHHSVSPILLTSPPPLTEKIRALHGSLYRRSDLAVGGLHGGIFMFRDVFARVTVPFMFGRVGIKPHEMTDLSDMQVRWLYSTEHDRRMFLDQFSDVFDFAGGISNLGKYKAPPKDSAEIFGLAAFQLQAAAAALSAAFDFRGAVQSALSLH